MTKRRRREKAAPTLTSHFHPFHPCTSTNQNPRNRERLPDPCRRPWRRALPRQPARRRRRRLDRGDGRARKKGGRPGDSLLPLRALLVLPVPLGAPSALGQDGGAEGGRGARGAEGGGAEGEEGGGEEGASPHQGRRWQRRRDWRWRLCCERRGEEGGRRVEGRGGEEKEEVREVEVVVLSHPLREGEKERERVVVFVVAGREGEKREREREREKRRRSSSPSSALSALFRSLCSSPSLS